MIAVVKMGAQTKYTWNKGNGGSLSYSLVPHAQKSIAMKELTTDQVPVLLKELDAILFDCDGVLWKSHEVIEGAREAILACRKADCRVFFVSNNSTLTRKQYVDRLGGHDIQATEEEIVSSAYVTAELMAKQEPYASWLVEKKGPAPKVFVLGHEGVLAELNERGIVTTGGQDLPLQGTVEDARLTALDKQVAGVVVGNFCYQRLSLAMGYLLNPDIVFMATNRDPQWVSPSRRMPGTGSIIACVEAATLRKPLVAGKPEKGVIEILIDRYQFDKQRMMIVGDNLLTDIALAQHGIRSLLVETGIHTAKDAAAMKVKNEPEWVADSIKILAHA